MRKISVRPESRIDSASSFGVFCRSAPSTSAIMRSMKVEPGAAVMRTLMRSESTVVPPVTAERSPPASRMTGADSPVIALSLTEAKPSTISPSPGMMSPASTSTTSPTRRSSALTPLIDAVERLGGSTRALGARVAARLAQGVRLRLAAPFGDGFGEIGEQHGEPQPERDLAGEQRRALVRDEIAHEERASRRAETTSVTKITGLRASARGSSLRKASTRRRADNLRVEQALRLDFGGHGRLRERVRFRRPCRRASGNARRPARARARGNIAADRG